MPHLPLCSLTDLSLYQGAEVLYYKLVLPLVIRNGRSGTYATSGYQPTSTAERKSTMLR